MAEEMSFDGLSIEPLLAQPHASVDEACPLDLMAAIEEVADGLAVGELLHGKLFSLGEAMSALEMMDAQMDSGMAKPHRAAATAPAVELSAWNADELRPVWPRALSAPETIGAMDELLALLMLHVRGHALAQTIFRCAWAHEPDTVACALLRLTLVAVVRIADAAHVAVVRAAVCEEEDYVTATAGLPLAEGVGEAELLAQLASADALLEQRLQPRAADGGVATAAAAAPPAGWEALDGATVAQLRAWRARLLAVRALFVLVSPLRRHSAKEPVALRGEAAGASAALLEQLAAVRASAREGCTAAQLRFAFGDECTAHVRGSAPQRVLPPVERDEAFGACEELARQLGRVPTLLQHGCLDDLLNAYADLCVRTRLQPLARTALRIVVLCAHEEERDDDDALSLRALVRAAVVERQRALLPADALERALAAEQGVEALGRCVHALLVHLQLFCHNDARRRRKLGKLLLEWGGVQLEVEDFDLALHRAGALPRECAPFSAWLSAHTTLLCAEQLRLGFRLRLYHLTELHAILWYLYATFALGAQLLAPTPPPPARADAAAAAAAAAGPRAKGWAKRRQQGPDGGARASPPGATAAAPPAGRTPTQSTYEAQRELCRGVHLLLSGLIKQGAVGTGEHSFMSHRERFERRLAPMRALLHPTPPLFEEYERMLSVDAHSASTLYSAAAACLKAARVPLELALRSPHGTLSTELACELRDMVKVAVQNGVAAAQLAQRAAATPPGAPPTHVAWECARHCDFPVIVLELTPTAAHSAPKPP